MIQATQDLRIHTLRISEHQSIQGTREQLNDRFVSGLLKGFDQVAAWVDARLDAQKGVRA